METSAKKYEHYHFKKRGSSKAMSPSPLKTYTVHFNLNSLRSSNSVSPSLPTVSLGSLNTSIDQAPRKNKNGKKRHSGWYRLQRKLPRKGVVAIENSHPHHQLVSCVRQGIRELNRKFPAFGPKVELNNLDFTEVLKTEIQSNKKIFEFESYSPSVFATIRQAIDITENEFLNSVAPVDDHPYYEFISNSKSGQDFFLSNNMQFMFKSNRQRDVKFFISILRNYLQHFISYPHSLLVKYVGCYAIKFPGKPKKYFLVMQSIFYPSDRIEERFDIKGCTAGRYQKPNAEGSQIIIVLKDQNFLTEVLDFGDQNQWFLQQIQADSEFLCGLNCMDYSLLIGRQRKHTDEKVTEHVATIVERIGKSISPIRKGMLTSNGDALYNSKGDYTNRALNDLKESTFQDIITLPEYKPGVMFPRSLTDGVENFHKEHRRLLPKSKNALHILDGEEYRYFVGVVDFLTRFDWRQKTAQYWKIVKYSCGDHSTKSPKVYSRRFINFLRDHVR
ncbi:phosphatidylinositol 4-phosphate 5-kinase-like protein 1 isoform X1 [Biomphalaria glabrata]|uniref:Phosphatidylinositol 4-phosphate 5-kinase-like protein 1 isoform X1 n=1 Tax=Biomphalaria glabrata TaxID=6526 RepID=A0A9U8EBL9_BIOGL|nr:phosphatidylinositol 4-phosphate 5-kinase-like protein 1 isoform X1 [Biomphalaria glabrata]XP_013081383.2 phosphatidylinositol 4-phosphate 5-kinase-like protein 1 isoform X1 [Biomphalaria glabrata]XP_013081384.2 phosphatidylinositol 4-phosphate 5-kinase-like protein 1 isoform X1 [Biomphalaria glabrata]XP_055897630.1 phosphatidylinositol 4-phosphate 5-kinase-like protein 1 isoform X1 [Biomphalaria glabrata]